MLTHLHIKNFATVATLQLDFAKGFNILTGETGAGKSIWIDAVNMALGERADTQQIRQGQSQAEITLCFDLTNNVSAQRWLTKNDLTDNIDDECIIRRVITIEGRSRNSINGTPCSLQQLREFSVFVLHIHGQHQQQTLLKPDSQRLRLDYYADNKKLLREVNNIYKQWKIIQEELNTIKNNTQNHDAEISLLQYQLEELRELNLQENEWQELSRTHQQLHNAKQLITQLNQAIELTVENEEVSAAALVDEAIAQLSQRHTDDPQINNIKELLNTAAIHLQEAANEINHYRDHIDLSPENLAEIENRLSRIHDIARKHHTNPESLFQIQVSLEHKLSQLENADQSIATLEKTATDLLKKYQKFAKQLTERRKQAANEFNQNITASMQKLGISGGAFNVAFTETDANITTYGNEQVCFTVQTNPNQAFQPIQKIASGGELSRISLAIQLLTANKQQTPTLIFDEVDVGIGGKTAAIVGAMLRQLGASAQVLCITHLPQVAAHGHHHYKVEKTTQNGATTTAITLLNDKQRVDEIARMLGGAKITKQTVAHASEMLSSC